MEDNNNIGELFRTKLAGLDKEPNDALWNAIEKDLDKRKKRKTLFWFFSSVVFIGILSAVLVLNQNNQDKNSDNNSKKETVLAKEIKQKDGIQGNKADKTSKSTSSNPLKITKNKSSESSETTSINKTRTEKLVKQSSKLIVSTEEKEEYEVIKKYKVIIKKNTTVTKVKKNSDTKTPVKPNKVVQKNSPKRNYTKKKNGLAETKKTAETTPSNKALETVDNNENVKKVTENEGSLLIKKADTIKEPTIHNTSKKKTTVKREFKKDSTNYVEELNPDFYFTVFYGPTIFGALAGESMINPSFTNLAKSHPITSFYGFYAKTMYNKIGFRAGISKINLEMLTRLNKNQMIQNYSNIELNSNTSVVTINNTFKGADEVDLIQKISFYELPLEFNYSILKNDKKFGLDFFSGFSLMIRDENSLYLSSNEIKNLNIGLQKNISSVNISYTLGLNLNYKLNKKFLIDFNPIFKYYPSLFKEQGNTSKPFSFSVQPGLTYKF